MIYNSQKGFSPKATWIHFLLLRHGTLDNVHPPNRQQLCMHICDFYTCCYLVGLETDRERRFKCLLSSVCDLTEKVSFCLFCFSLKIIHNNSTATGKLNIPHPSDFAICQEDPHLPPTPPQLMDGAPPQVQRIEIAC